MPFTGFSAFPLTPTSADGQLNPTALRQILDPILAANVDSIGLLGSTGAYPYLTPEVRKETLRVALDHVNGAVPIVVGVGAMRTDMAVDLAKDAARAGTDGLLLAPLSYQILTQEEVYEHFATVAGASDLPICIYNNPGTTQFHFSDDLIARLAQIPSIKAIKMPLPTDGNFKAELARLRALTPGNFQIGYSGDWGCAEALLAGAACWHSAIGGILPSQCRTLSDAARAGDQARTAALTEAFSPIWKLTKSRGSYRTSYAIARALGVADVSPLPPVQRLSDPLQNELGEAVAHLNKAIAQ